MISSSEEDDEGVAMVAGETDKLSNMTDIVGGTQEWKSSGDEIRR